MSKRLKNVILIVGIAILVISLATLVYVYWPIPVVQFHQTISPTLFAPPP